MKRWIIPVLAGALVAVVGLLYSRHYVAEEAIRLEAGEISRTTALVSRAIRAHDELVDSLSARFERIDDLKTAQEQQLRRVRNADHLTAARRLGIGRSPGPAELNALIEEGRLVRLDDNDFYWVQELDYSVPYVTPEMAEALDEIGRRLHAALEDQDLPPFRFNVSSVLRTSQNQQDLRRINPNAARGVSAHEFGTTVDVVYHTYDFVPDSDELRSESTGLDSLFTELRHRSMHGIAMIYWQELQGLLGRILIDMQREGILLVTLEREQPVFHMTLARPISSN